MPIVSVPLGDLAQILFDDAFGYPSQAQQQCGRGARQCGGRKAQSRACPSTGNACESPSKCGRGACGKAEAKPFQPAERAWAPRADIVETATEYTVALELPGVGRSNINVSFDNNVLTVEGHGHATFPQVAAEAVHVPEVPKSTTEVPPPTPSAEGAEWESVEKSGDSASSSESAPGATESSAAKEGEADAPSTNAPTSDATPVQHYQWHKYERNRGAFQRAFEFPDNVDAARLSARYEDGVLFVTLPKQNRPKTAYSIPIA